MEKIEGIVLKQINYKENSKIIYLYTPQGKVSVLVHGSNKVKSPYLNLVRLFSHVSLVVSGKSLKTIRDGNVISYFDELSNDLTKYTYSLHLMELIYYFSDHDHDHEKLFRFLLKIFHQMILSKDVSVYVMMVELKLLYLLGVQPLMKHCVYCQSQEGLQFSVAEGGMVCVKHHKVSQFHSSTIQLMQQLYYYDLDHPKPFVVEDKSKVELRQLIDDYYAFHLNYKGKSRKMLKEIIGY